MAGYIEKKLWEQELNEFLSTQCQLSQTLDLNLNHNHHNQ